jgi:CRP-like cAMP-binding protein
MAKAQAPPARSANRLLARLPPGHFDRLFPLLQAVTLEPRQVIYHVRSPLNYVYFPASGVISAMTVMKNGSTIEVATIGKEGVVGLTAFLGAGTSPYEVMVQVPGHGWRMRADAFHAEAQKDGPLRQLLVLYNTAFATQISYSVACNGLHTVEKRCCRWLLMTQDRVGQSELPLTHEFLAIMLGVRRASITEVLRPLQKRGLIHNGRGRIEVLDRPGLEAHACECYEAVIQEFARLFP